jgi:hypothetical protein
MRLPSSIKYPILAHLENKSVLEMSVTSLSSLYKKVTPWVSGIATNSTTAVWIGDANLSKIWPNLGFGLDIAMPRINRDKYLAE